MQEPHYKTKPKFSTKKKLKNLFKVRLLTERSKDAVIK